MSSKHNSGSYSKFILKSASILLILFVTFSQYSILHFDNSYSNQTLDNKENELSNNKGNTPQSAAGELFFTNDFLQIIIDDKGCISDEWWNLKYQGLYQDWYYMSYLSINDGEVQPFDIFTPIKSLTNLTDFTFGGYTNQLVGETILQHPDENVFVKVQIKLYPDEEFFVMTFMIWSDTIDIDKAELFIYNDVDMDTYSNDDDALYSSSTELISGNDKVNNTQLGWTSPHSIASWDMGDPYDIYDNVINDTLAETSSLNNEDISLTTKYQRLVLNANDIWTVPLIYGFGTSYSHLVTNTVDVKNYFINDFSVLDFTANLTDNPSVNATILNGGQNKLTRNVSVFRNGTYLQSHEIELSPGELGNVTFENLVLNSGEYNNITVSVNNSVNDYEPNNNISHTYQYQDRFRINIKDIDGIDVEGLNVSLYQNTTQTLIKSTFTDEIGNATFVNLPEDNYTLRAYVPWVNNQIIYEENLTYVEDDEYYQIQTNMTTLVLQIQDVAGFSVFNATINITKDGNSDVIWIGNTDQNGNVTFQFLNQTYDINVTYYDYEKSLILEPISDFSLSEKTYHTHQVNLTDLTFHLKTRSDENPQNFTGAKLEFYEKIDNISFGNPIGFEIADSIGNVSILWDARINYSIRVSFFAVYLKIGDPEDDSINLIESPYNSYIYRDINVTFGNNPDEYSTEIVLLNSLPIRYTWEENIDIEFMFNVSGPTFEYSKWADKTSIEIYNQDYISVYNGTATIIFEQEGKHSFVVNTSCGNFTSDNPETYTVNIFAQNYSYGVPAEFTFTFNIYNITTGMDLHSSSETLYWKDNFTISANYFEKITSDPIIDGVFTVSWGNNLINYPMQNLENGTYMIEIDSSLGTPGNSIVTVKGFRENYNFQERKFYLNVMEVPTTVNGSILFGSGHSQYVTTQNLTLEYNFIDSYRNILIPDLSPMYQMINSETEEQYTGYLTYNESGAYTFDPKSALLPIGTYHGLIDFSLDNYVSSYASVQFEILPIPLSLTFKGGSTDDANDFENSTEYSIERGENFYFEIKVSDIYDNPVQDCNISYTLAKGDQIQNGYLQTDNTGHYFGNFSEFTEIGLYSLSLSVYKANYTVETYQFYIDVEYETYLGGIPLPYLLVGALVLLIAISAVVGYAGIKRMKIPRYIKDLTKLEKILKNPKNLLPDGYPTRIEQLKGKYGKRWEEIDLQFPLKPQIDEIKNFIETYQEMTGKLFLKEEAKQFLDDLVIYSEDEIKRRLEAERIFGENLSKLMEIILKYIQTTSVQHDLETDPGKVVDDFDLEFGDDK